MPTLRVMQVDRIPAPIRFEQVSNSVLDMDDALKTTGSATRRRLTQMVTQPPRAVSDQLLAAFEYSTVLTPNITSISPEFGTSAGGTRVTIVGTKFGTVIADVSVLVDGVACVVSDVTATKVVCVTGAKPYISASSFKMTIAKRGLAINNSLAFIYMDRSASAITPCTNELRILHWIFPAVALLNSG